MTSELEKLIAEQYGDRCPEYDAGCPRCQIWAEYDTRAMPDVHELETIGWLLDDERLTDNFSSFQYNVDHNLPVKDVVLKDQAAEIIAAKDKEIEKFICALSTCQKALDSLVSEESIKNTTVVNAYAMCVDAELKARKALKGESNV